MQRIKFLAFAGACVATVLAARASGGSLVAWVVDPHVKVFKDAGPFATAGVVALRAARNEYEPGQIAIRSSRALKGVRLELLPLKHVAEKRSIDGENLDWHFVGFIPLKKNTPHADTLRLRAAPCEVPDPLLEARTLDVEADTTQPVWLTVRVPKDATPGKYQGTVAVVAGDERVALPVDLTVDPFTLPDERHLLVTNWFNTGNIAKAHRTREWSEPFWTLLEQYARHMAEHRQNVFYAPWTLVDVSRESDGRLTFDYARFDRYVETFLKAGVSDRIELRHVGHFGEGGWGGSEIVLSKVTATDRKTGKGVTLSAAEGLAPLLADLQRHLAERGWLERAMIHVADEPSINNIQSWRRASAFVHKAAPKIRRIDAIETLDFTGALEVWVPKLSHFERWREAYEARRADNEFWFYICCHPFGNAYPNRFLDYPLASVRVLHWINFACDLPGYLHWGLNFWGDDPFGVPPDRLPPGDTHVIYPGREGPLGSLRWEIQRESIEDYEYLHLLTAKTAAAKKRLGEAAAFIRADRRAREFCRRVVPSITEWERDPARIAAVRQAIADEIVALDAEPLLLVETEPAEGTVLVNGPIVVEVRGVVQPGTAVRVGGRAVEVRTDGSFACLGGGRSEVSVEAAREGRTRTTIRRFRVRD
ncbi:MAG TPA: glycoside hydrolase domain-containing protein [Phycisphaerae bacterium]|nr:glycoside hydrolase domain-containing protein [Phycisphaerae bacterium]